MKAALAKAGRYTVEQIPVPHSSVDVDLTRPRAGVMHTTEGSFESALSVFEQHFAPHFLIGKDKAGKIRLVQLVPLGKMASALENPAGGVETNRWAVCQIEVAGFSKDKPWLFEPALLDVLAELLAALTAAAGIPLSRPFADKMPPKPWATPAFPRRHAGKWGKVAGWYGHVDVPEQSHWDPGALEWTRLLVAAQLKRAPAQPDLKMVPSQALLAEIGRRLG